MNASQRASSFMLLVVFAFVALLSITAHHGVHASAFPPPTAADDSNRHIVLMSVYLPGHLAPLLSQAEELHSRGWRVSVASSERARSHVEKSLSHLPNAKFLSCGTCASDLTRDEVYAQAVVDPSFVNSSHLMTDWTSSFWPCMYDGCLPLLQQDKPVGMVIDSFSFYGFDLAATLGVPYVVSWPFTLATFSTSVSGPADYLPFWASDLSLHKMETALSQRVLGPLIRPIASVLIAAGPAAKLNAMRAERGLAPADWLTHNVGRLVLVTSAFPLEYPRPLPPLIQLVGPMITHADVSLDQLSTEDRQWLEASPLPVVYICMGTLWQPAAWHVTAFLEASRSSKYRVLLKMGKLGFRYLPAPEHIPENVKIVDWVSSQKAVLHHPNVKVFVSHCGHNGVYESVLARTLLICIPGFADQLDEAHRVVDAGVGLKIQNKNNFTGEELQQLMLALLDPQRASTFRASVERVRSAILLAGGVTKAVSLIEHAFRHGVDEWLTIDTRFPWYAAYNIDVLLVYLVTLWILKEIFSALFSCCCSCRSSAKAKAKLA